MDKKRLEEDIVALVFSLFFFAFMYFFISPNLTGLVIYEPSYSYNVSEINTTNGLSIKSIINTTTITATTKYEFGLISALADGHDVLSKVITLDINNEEIKKDRIFDITFNGSLNNGDIITFKADDVKDVTNVYLCSKSVACAYPGYGGVNVSDAGIYSLTVSGLSAANDSFNFDPPEKVKINHINATKTVTTTSTTTTYPYPTYQIEIITEDIQPTNLSSWGRFIRNDSLNGQNISYQYSIDSGSNWITMPGDNNLTGINSTRLKIKAIMQSDGTTTPFIYSLSVNYTELIANYTGNSTNSTVNQTNNTENNSTNSSQTNSTESNSTNSTESNSTGSGGGASSSSGQASTPSPQSNGISARERAARTAAAPASSPSAPTSAPAPSAPTQSAAQPITGKAIKVEGKFAKESSIVAKIIIGSIILLILITIVLTIYEYRKRKALKGRIKK